MQTRYPAVIEHVQPRSDGSFRGVFGPDECFGLAWSILHLIETAPG